MGSAKVSVARAVNLPLILDWVRAAVAAVALGIAVPAGHLIATGAIGWRLEKQSKIDPAHVR
jgi:hypothetical protein